MGGDIAILDKEIGEKGTCFRFSVLLTVSVGNINSGEVTCQSSPTSRLTFQAPSPSLHSPRVIRTTGSKTETSRVILLIRNDQRRMVCKKFMETLGVKVLAMKQWSNSKSLYRKYWRNRAILGTAQEEGQVIVHRVTA